MAGDYELSQAIYIFNINLAIYSDNKNKNYYTFINYYENTSNNQQKPLIILKYEQEAQHYQLLLFKDNIYLINNEINHIKDNNNNFSILNENTKDNKFINNNIKLEIKKEIENIIKKYKLLNIKDDKFIDEDTFILKLKEGYNFPKYPNHKEGKNLLIYIRNYLILKKKNKKDNLYPKYIVNSNNAETLKRYFRRIASNYIVDDNNFLYIKYYKDNSNNSKVNKIYNKNNSGLNYIEMKVPFVKDILKYIYDIHSKNNHRGIDAIRNYFIKNKIFYKGIIKDIKSVINNCAICKIKNSKVDLKKKIDIK